MTMTETDLEALNFPDAPKMVSAEFPGPKSADALAQSARTESMARGAGRAPVVIDRAFGVTFKDPDGNTFIDLSAGVGVSSVGRCHPKVVAAMLARVSDEPPVKRLSTRERDVLIGIAEGLSNKAMAHRLGISARTIETHRSNIMRKLNIRTIAGLTRFAVSQGLVSMDKIKNE